MRAPYLLGPLSDLLGPLPRLLGPLPRLLGPLPRLVRVPVRVKSWGFRLAVDVIIIHYIALR